jgi:ribonuclease P protein component
VGVVVPRFKQTAVARNVVKRRLRDLARTELLPNMPALDLVIRAFPGAYGASYDTLRAAVQHAGRQLPKGVPEDAA